jgi:hypothetical protein
MSQRSERIAALLAFSHLQGAVEAAVEHFRAAGFDEGAAASHAQGTLRQLARALSGPASVPPPLAIVGTTCAGKSSLVNALLGVDLAPVDTRELSAGVLSIRHGVGETRTWTHGTPSDEAMGGLARHAAPEDAGLHIEALLHARRIERAAGGQPKRLPPAVDVEADLTSLAQLLGLPSPAGLEVRDLPGLRTVDDEANARTITKSARDAVVVVVTSYTAVHASEEQDHLGELLREARTPGRDGPAPLLLLNRADERAPTDSPSLEALASQQADQWSASLGVRVEPIVTSSQLLRVGAALRAPPPTDPVRAAEQGEWARQLGERPLKRLGALAKSDRRRVRAIWDGAEDGEPLRLEDRAWLAAACLAASGGDALSRGLRERLLAGARPSPLHHFLREAAHRGGQARPLAVQRRAARAVSVALAAVMYADGEAHPRELRMVARLSRDYCERFAPDTQPPEPGPQAPAWPEVQAALGAVQWTSAEARWVRRACELVMAADTIQRPQERDALARIDVWLRRG